MTDNQNEDQPVPTDQPAEKAADKAKPGWRERTLGLRGVAAVALASLILGGAGGAALGALSNGADGDRGRDGFGPGQFQPPPGGGGPGGMVPPGTTPPDDVQPDSGSTESSGDTT